MSNTNEKITVLVVEPGKEPYEKEIAPDLASLQHEVGGYIQAVYPHDDPVAVICDEEGKLKGSPLNRALRDEDGQKHGNRLSFRLRGQAQWMVPGRRDPLFTEDGIRKAIQGNLEAIEAGLRPVLIARRPYVPYKKHPKYTGFMALYVHYLYLLGKIKKREYPPKMTPHLKAEIMKFEKYKAQFKFLHENHITGPEQLAAHRAACEERLAALTKHRTILNARKKKRKPLYDALADAEALRPAMDLYAQGMTGMEDEAARYMDAVDVLEKSGVPLEQLKAEKAAAYEAVAEVNRDIRAIRKQIALCDEITNNIPQIEKDVHSVERTKTKEVNRDVREF